MKKQMAVRLTPTELRKFNYVRNIMQERAGSLSKVTNDALFLDMLDVYAKRRNIDFSELENEELKD